MSHSTQEPQVKRIGFHLVNILTFFLGIFFRLSVIGWIFLFFAIFEVVIRVIYIILMSILIERSRLRDTLDKSLYTTMIIMYLVVSLFTVDAGDQASYTLMHYWKNPPSWMFFVNYTLVGIFILMLTGVFLRNRRLKKTTALS